MNSNLCYSWTSTPLGNVLLVADGDALCGLYFGDQKYVPAIDPSWKRDDDLSVLRTARRQIDEYFAGARERFDVALAPSGTPFQRAIWKAIAEVPSGATRTYADLAKRVGRPGSARAAGAATGRNPLSIIVPCHRIIGSDGSLTGYAGGLDRKRRLLELERSVIVTARRAA
jgi:methylated-DNA-[protein]-cysteine S-methyltransferase